MVEIARRVRAPIADPVVRRVIAATLSAVRCAGDISVAFIGPTQMRTINRTYHGSDDATDVLAFAEPLAVSRKALAGQRRALGEIIVCPAVAKRNATRAGAPWQRELVRLLVHGTLHCCGYDHAKPAEAEEMFSIQEAVVQKVKRKK